MVLDSCDWSRDAGLGPELLEATAPAGQEPGAPERTGEAEGEFERWVREQLWQRN